MADGLYVRMCWEHPIQKEWKRKEQDIITVVDIPKKFPDVLYKPNKNKLDEPYSHEFERIVIWLPSQEQWQEKYQYGAINPTCAVDMIAGCFITDFWTSDFGKWFEKSNSLSDALTILWCLFVSREVYGLEWDWEAGKWKEVGK